MKLSLRTFYSLLLPVVIALTAISANAYVIYSVSGNVKVSLGGKISQAVKGAVLKKSDLVSIPDGASISIMDETTQRIYISQESGNTSVQELISKSIKAANDAPQINGRERGTPGSRIYREKGMVTRSLNLFDTVAANIEIEPDTLAQLIAHVVYFECVNADSTLNFVSAPIDTISNNGGYGFKLYNPLETPIYFNVLKIVGVHNRIVEISKLGQPGGDYILPPGHTMMRTCGSTFPYGETHLVVACHYSFDIDALIDSLNKIINDDTLIIEDSDPNLPVFIRLI